MKLNPKSYDFIHLKQFSTIYPEIILDDFEDLICGVCLKKFGKYHVSDPYGFMGICMECLENEA